MTTPNHKKRTTEPGRSTSAGEAFTGLLDLVCIALQKEFTAEFHGAKSATLRPPFSDVQIRVSIDTAALGPVAKRRLQDLHKAVERSQRS